MKRLCLEPTIPDADLTGRLAIVVGNAGREAIVEYQVLSGLISRKLSDLVLAVHDVAEGEQIRRRLIEGHPTAYCKVDIWQLDLERFSSVQAFGQRMNNLARLDILIVGPGICKTSWEASNDGYELSLQVNVLSSGLVCLLALPLMNRTAGLAGLTHKPHIVLSASGPINSTATRRVHESESFISTLNDKAKFASKDRYKITQVLVTYIARELSTLKIAKGVNVSCVTLGDPAKFRGAIPSFFHKRIAGAKWSPDKVARSYLHALLVDSSRGALIHNGKKVELSDKWVLSSDGQESQKKVWRDLRTIWKKQSNEAAAVLM